VTDFQIKCFLHLATYKSFTRAAEILGITQPALSREISAFEKGLNLVLFKRTKQGIFLTPEGSILFSVFKDTDKKIRSGLEHARAVQENNQNSMSIGFLLDWRIDGSLSKLIRKCRRNNPAFQIQIKQMGSRDLIEALDEGNLDLVFDLNSPLLFQNDVVVLPFYKTRGYIMAPISRIIPVEHFQAMQFVDDTIIAVSQHLEDQGVANYLQNITGFKPKQIVIVNSAEAQYLSVKCGLGIGAICDLSINFEKDDMNYFKTGQNLQVMIYYKKSNPNPLLHYFCTSISNNVVIV
jgi:DNA-binding transcriptional LysR family regulator